MAQKQKKKTKQISQRRLKAIHRRLRFWRIILAGIAVALVIFNFVLIISGSLDDVNNLALLIAPMIAMGALAVALIDVKKYKGSNVQIIVPLALVGIGALFYLIVSISQAIVVSSMI